MSWTGTWTLFRTLWVVSWARNTAPEILNRFGLRVRKTKPKPLNKGGLRLWGSYGHGGRYLLGDSWYLVTNYNCTYSPHISPLSALRWL